MSGERERDVEIRESEEIMKYYSEMLSELTLNSKPLITHLTILAGQLKEHAPGISHLISSRILSVEVEQKLPSLYLLDSIVKNIGGEYASYFAAQLPEVFCEAYRQVPPNLHRSMRHLFGTWSTVFPSSVLRKIEEELQFYPSISQPPTSTVTSMRASESPRSSHDIHVNPKYLEARRQFDNPSISSNAQLASGKSSLKIIDQKHPVVYDDCDSDMGESATSNLVAQRLSSSGYGGRTSFSLSADKSLPSVSGQGRPLSPSVDEFAVSKSPRRIVEKTPSSLLGYNYGRRMRERDEEIGDRQKRLCADDLYRGFEHVGSSSYSNSLNHDRPRALIDAYGHDGGHKPLNAKPLGMDSRVTNGVASKVAAQSWIDTEVEEFDWEDMSPTLANSRTNDLAQSLPLPFGSFGAGPGLDPLGSKPFDPSLRSSNWTISNQICRLEDSHKAVEDSHLIRDSVNGLSDKGSISRNEASQITEHHRSLGAWKLSSSLTEPVHDVSDTGRESSSRLAFPAREVPPYLDGKSSPGVNFAAVSDVTSRVVSSGFSYEASTPSPSLTSLSAGLRPSTSVNNMIPLRPLYPLQQHRGPVDFVNPIYQITNDDTRLPANLMQLSRPVFTPLLHPSRPPQMMRPPVSLSYTPLGHGVAASNIMNNATLSLNSSLPIQNVPYGFVQHQARVPALPRGPYPPSQILPLPLGSGSIANQLPTVGVSGLINSLVAQGVLSLAKQTPAQDSLGVEFNADLLKVRHESSTRALYDDLPRQCKTCGLRFKSQEEHSKHMDWHVTKNRITKNRKQNLSRKWFVNASMWLSGAEALGTDTAPGFLPTETVVEKKEDEEMAVLADEHQSNCALCGEPFEDFYSDEAEEWMYRGAVYLNVPDGSVVDMDRSQLGPIVHAKCRSDSSAAYS